MVGSYCQRLVKAGEGFVRSLEVSEYIATIAECFGMIWPDR